MTAQATFGVSVPAPEPLILPLGNSSPSSARTSVGHPGRRDGVPHRSQDITGDLDPDLHTCTAGGQKAPR